GDVNRNVMCTSLPEQSAIHAQAYAAATAISAHLTPQTSAYHEIWLGKEKVAGGEEEPIYGPTYLPRKFKIGVAIPPSNDVDILTQDLGFIAIERDGQLAGFNVSVGGGMGMTHGDPATYPRLATVIGFCTPLQVLEVAEQVVKVQRDFGDRENRKHARLKYTIDDRGVDWFKSELEERLGYALKPEAPYRFVSRGDHFGWVSDAEDRSHLTLFIPEGRVQDTDEHGLRSALREVAERRLGAFRVTANQNLIVSDVEAGDVAAVDALLKQYGVDKLQGVSPLREQALACVALPTCGLAMAEAERYLPALSGAVESLLDKHGLGGEPVSLRITGCPNGCARPYAAEIGLVGKAPGQYALFLAGNADGTRLNRLALENANEETILNELDGWFGRYAGERRDGESFGDFVNRELQAA
ncbi:MAG: NADPH-dependent assimilatory sulfite reductase hemoprotein subunit, partial [Pseudomonadota bacterium]